jgi:hypothetical protein
MRRLVVLAVLAATLIFTGTANAAVQRFSATMSGAQEEPDPGDTNGSGTASIRMDRAKRTVCFTIRVRNIGRVVAGHIHEGAKGVPGGIVVPLIDESSTRTRFTGCAEDVERSLITKMQRRPSRYYVNVHSEDFPAGAVRGQLKKVRRR